MNSRTVLLNPGPVTLSERVRQAMLRGDWCHRELEFAELTRSIDARLAAVYPAAERDFEAVIMTGSGTAALEAMLGGFAPDHHKTLVVANGVYGERSLKILELQRKPVQVVASAWTAAINCVEVARALSADKDITHIEVVHHETTTGRLNDLSELAQLARDHSCQLLIDAVSSFGAEEIDFENWPIAAVAATANKCLHAVPGVSFVLARADLWRAGSSKAARSLYLDPFAYHAAQHSDGYSPFTQSIQAAFALDEALSELADEGGWQARRELYRARAARIADELAKLGVEPLFELADRSCVLCAFRLPAGTSYASLHRQLKQDGFIIYAGQGHLAADICRIANMGDIRADDLDRFADSFRRAMA